MRRSVREEQRGTSRANLLNQAQGIARFQIEPYDGAISPNVEFFDTTIGFARPHLDNCRLDERGPDDVVAMPLLLDGGQACYIDKIILKAPGKPQLAKDHPKFH